MDGIARVCESKLVLEFEARESLFRIGTREVACPFGEIESVAFKERGLLRYVLLFGTKRLHPSSRAGQFALYVAREHKSRVREAESLLLYGPARRDLSGMRDSLSSRRRHPRLPEDTA